MVVNAAALASQCQVPYFGLVSSVGANPHSLLPYAKTKGMRRSVATHAIPTLEHFQTRIVVGSADGLKASGSFGKVDLSAVGLGITSFGCVGACPNSCLRHAPG